MSAERSREALNDLALDAVDGQRFGITGSFGIVTLTDQDLTVPHFIQRASQAVKLSKTLGKNRVTFLD